MNNYSNTGKLELSFNVNIKKFPEVNQLYAFLESFNVLQSTISTGK